MSGTEEATRALGGPGDRPVRVDRAAIGALAKALLEAAGASARNARIVTDHLIDASAMGLHSHGLMRVPQYLEDIVDGRVDPVAEPTFEPSAPARLRVRGERVFGQVAGMAMVEKLIPLARDHGLGMAVGRGLGHTGRVGAYPEALARAGLIGIAACSGPPSGHWVAAFGGRDGRISTNPLAFAWPVEGEPPVVGDFSTAATAEGVVRSLRNRGLAAPPGVLRDADGLPTSDPGVLYATPRGSIQPLGGDLGYRGTALALLVEVLTTLLAGEATDDASRQGTDMTLLAIASGADLAPLARRLSAHIRASAPIDPARPVLMPGDRERAAAASVASLLVDGPTWSALARAAAQARIPMPHPMQEGGRFP